MSTLPAVDRVLCERMASGRARTDQLFQILRPEAYYSRPIAERHRLIFYLGHLEAFDWNQICRQGLGIPSFHPEFDRLFEFGIDPPVGEHPVEVPRFSILKNKVTNGDYLNFVRAGAAPPHFWIQRNGELLYSGMFAEIPLPLNAPVYVTYEQASAYARWTGKELPTEAQFHRAAYGTPSGEERNYPWGDAPPSSTHGNFDFHDPDPVDVDANPAGDSAFGVSQLVGNGWEWTRTPFGPFAGFQPFPFYAGYSQNFFDEEHYVMKGASPQTARCFPRRS